MNNADALELAASATFLKVGHHGSHNATPISFINEHLPTKTPAMISTLAGLGNYRNGILRSSTWRNACPESYELQTADSLATIDSFRGSYLIPGWFMGRYSI